MYVVPFVTRRHSPRAEVNTVYLRRDIPDSRRKPEKSEVEQKSDKGRESLHLAGALPTEKLQFL